MRKKVHEAELAIRQLGFTLHAKQLELSEAEIRNDAPAVLGGQAEVRET
jgi:hypothetical protein